eukprot:Seg679.1 transcript_id=Seg679.1/GoldUCD/mRNA.D3Y31 product="Actin-related protein 10" protein_id=Seg679.1/GoldUCD/D3Y31
MALMEMIGLGGDKQAVILDIGEAYTKIGFAGESTPRHIIPSRVRRLVGSELVETKVVKYDANEDELFDILREFLHSIYFRYLLVNPKERKVVISESLLAPVKFRNTLAKVLFKYFDVVSVMFAPCHLFALFTLGVSSALVVDCGYSETLVVPIYEHTPILAAVESFQIAGRAIHGTLREELLQSTGHDLKEDVIENIKVTSCFIGSYGKPSECVPPPIEYPIGDGTMIKIDGKIRANSFNAMFDGDEEEKSVATTILSAIARCPIDCRKALSENIVLIGGSTMVPGFEARILAELKQQLNGGLFSKKLAFKNLKLRRPPVQANYVSWLGAAIYGMLETLSEYSISREKYKERAVLPDWASLSSYTNNSGEKQDARAKLSSYRKTVSQSPKS